MSAAATWGLRGYDLEPVHVMRERSGPWRSQLAIVHEPTLLLPEHVVRRGAMRVTTPSRTLFDIAAYVEVDRLARAVDEALVLRLTNTKALHRMLDVLGVRGRPGITNMRVVLDERGTEYRPPESNLERRVMDVLATAGFPAFDRQVDVGDESGWIARVDFLCRSLRFILFVDGDRWHSTISDRAADHHQALRLDRAGFSVWRISEALALGPSARLADSVRDGLRLARRAS
jgi:very-short-patch-repair endonuclease